MRGVIKVINAIIHTDIATRQTSHIPEHKRMRQKREKERKRQREKEREGEKDGERERGREGKESKIHNYTLELNICFFFLQ